MKTMMGTMSAWALISTLAACSKQDEASADVVSMENDMNTMAANPNNRFTQSEMAMDKAMMAAVGVSAADSWVRKMIEHHRGAVEMSRIVSMQSPTADVVDMAQMTIEMQGEEIADLEKMAATGSPAPASAELYRSAGMQMHNAMMAASGANVSETFLRKMLAHHQGAVAVSDVALANGAAGAVHAQIVKTKATQQKEVAMVEAMLRGEPMPSIAPVASMPAATAPAVKPTAPKKAAAAKPIAAKPKSEPASRTKVLAPACLPEHRAAGHC